MLICRWEVKSNKVDECDCRVKYVSMTVSVSAVYPLGTLLAPAPFPAMRQRVAS